MKFWPLLLIIFMAAKCSQGEMASHSGMSRNLIQDNERLESGGDDISRYDSTIRGCNVEERAQNIFIQWGRDRKKAGRPLDTDVISKLLAVATHESGGKRGLGISNISPHRSEWAGNKAGYDGKTESKVSDVEDWFARKDRQKYISHQMSLGSAQISPDVFYNYPATRANLKNVAGMSSPNQVFAHCLSDMGYTGSDHGKVKNILGELIRQRGQIDGWVAAIKAADCKFPRNDAAARAWCTKDAGCKHASMQLGRWLLYCPKLNLESQEIVFSGNKKYFAAKTRKAAPVCKQVLYAEINKFVPNERLLVDNNRHLATGEQLL